MLCSECGNQLAKNAFFCDQCNNLTSNNTTLQNLALNNIRLCSNCQNKIKEGDHFCETCGEQLIKDVSNSNIQDKKNKDFISIINAETSDILFTIKNEESITLGRDRSVATHHYGEFGIYFGNLSRNHVEFKNDNGKLKIRNLSNHSNISISDRIIPAHSEWSEVSSTKNEIVIDGKLTLSYLD